jgi:hypothetical protein
MYSEPKAMQEIHEIRVRMYEEEKGLTSDQLVAKINSEAEEFKKKYGLNLRKATHAHK